MKKSTRLVAGLIGALMILGISAFPASAATVCVVVAGHASHDTGIGHVGLVESRAFGNGTVGQAGGLSLCVNSNATTGTLSATYAGFGNCGQSTGGGTINGTHDLEWISLGTILALTGANGDTVVGLVNAVVNSLVVGNNCFPPGTAKAFIISGAVILG